MKDYEKQDWLKNKAEDSSNDCAAIIESLFASVVFFLLILFLGVMAV